MNPAPSGTVAEFQGLYGPFACPERVLQKIWLRGEFARDTARTVDGRRLEVVHPGRWNLQGGPDFLGAQVRLEGCELRGDVEVHFRASDWRAHSHRENPAFAGVILHVLLFPPGPDERPALRADGGELPALALLPLLLRDLEEHVSDDALETLTSRDEWRLIAELASLPPGRLPPLLRQHAAARWRQKIRFARLRLDRLGWRGAAHHAALEILGYRHNRAPMLSVATRVPLEQWAGPGVDPDAIFAGDGLNWHRQGLRPANRPNARLRQYAAWVRARPDWPDRLAAWAERLSTPVEPAGPTHAARHEHRLADCRRELAAAVLAGTLGGSRLDNLACDGFLPLLAARTERDLLGTWFHWYLGDAPDQVRRALSRLGIARPPEQPICQGYAQGLLGWLVEREYIASGWRTEA
ncbi:MAG TPA: DUF2851 family protein [Opitutaceae bacterium]|nr:DUF2851 family protein [Opitutaceae bacterium]